MAITIEELRIVVQAEVGTAIAALKKLDDTSEKTAATAKAKAAEMRQAWQGIGQSLTMGITLPLAAVGAASIKFAMDMEKNQVAFGVMLKDMSKGKQLMLELRDIANTTPYETGDLTNAMKTMMQFGLSADVAKASMMQLGDVAMGDGQKLGQLALVFGQVSSAGKLQGQDLLQLINAGFNPLLEISEKTGESYSDLRAKMEKGEITFAMVQEAFKSVTGEGGRFNNMMVTMGQTASGKLSTAIDGLKTAGVDLGNIMLPAVTSVIEGVTDLAEGFASLPDAAKGLIIAGGVFAGMIGPAIMGVTGLIGVVETLQKANLKLVATQILVKATNPYFLAGVAVVGAFAAAWAVINEMKPETQMKRLADESKRAKEEHEELVTSIKKMGDAQKITVEQADKLKTLYPQLTKGLDTYNLSASEAARLAEKGAKARAEEESVRMAAALFAQSQRIREDKERSTNNNISASNRETYGRFATEGEETLKKMKAEYMEFLKLHLPGDNGKRPWDVPSQLPSTTTATNTTTTTASGTAFSLKDLTAKYDAEIKLVATKFTKNIITTEEDRFNALANLHKGFASDLLDAVKDGKIAESEITKSLTTALNAMKNAQAQEATAAQKTALASMKKDHATKLTEINKDPTADTYAKLQATVAEEENYIKALLQAAGAGKIASASIGDMSKEIKAFNDASNAVKVAEEAKKSADEKAEALKKIAEATTAVNDEHIANIKEIEEYQNLAGANELVRVKAIAAENKRYADELLTKMVRNEIKVDDSTVKNAFIEAESAGSEAKTAEEQAAQEAKSNEIWEAFNANLAKAKDITLTQKQGLEGMAKAWNTYVESTRNALADGDIAPVRAEQLLGMVKNASEAQAKLDDYNASLKTQGDTAKALRDTQKGIAESAQTYAKALGASATASDTFKEALEYISKSTAPDKVTGFSDAFDDAGVAAEALEKATASETEAKIDSATLFDNANKTIADAEKATVTAKQALRKKELDAELANEIVKIGLMEEGIDKEKAFVQAHKKYINDLYDAQSKAEIPEADLDAYKKAKVNLESYTKALENQDATIKTLQDTQADIEKSTVELAQSLGADTKAITTYEQAIDWLSRTRKGESMAIKASMANTEGAAKNLKEASDAGVKVTAEQFVKAKLAAGAMGVLNNVIQSIATSAQKKTNLKQAETDHKDTIDNIDKNKGRGVTGEYEALEARAKANQDYLDSLLALEAKGEIPALVEGQITKLLDAIATSQAPLDEYTQALDRQRIGSENLRQKQGDLEQSTIELSQAMGAKDSVDTYTEAIQYLTSTGAKGAGEIVVAYNQAGVAATALETATKKKTKADGSEIVAAEQAFGAITTHVDGLKEEIVAEGDAGDAAEKAAKDWESAAGTLGSSLASALKLSIEGGSIGEVVASLGNSLGNALGGLVSEGIGGMAGAFLGPIAGMLVGVAADAIGTALDDSIVTPLEESNASLETSIKALEASNRTLADAIPALEKTLDAARKTLSETLDQLRGEFDTEATILKDQWDRGLISDEEFATGMSTAQTNLATATTAAEAPVTAAQTAIDTSRAEQEYYTTKANALKKLKANPPRELYWYEGQYSLAATDIKMWQQKIDFVNGSTYGDLSGHSLLLSQLQAYAAADGADFVTQGPQLMMVGEGGRAEHVQVRPAPINKQSYSEGQQVIININAPVYGIENFVMMFREIEQDLIARMVIT